jgi:hypothetical protein
MKSRQELGEDVDLLRRWVLVSGRDVIATTRDSFVSIEGRAGISVFVGLWVLGRIGAGEWNVWGESLGGEILPVVRTWYAGGMVAFQSILLASHICLGVLWGVIVKNVWGLLGFFWPTAAAERFRPWVVGIIAGFVTLFLHSALLIRDLARHPALYQESFLDQGGMAHAIHIFSVEKMSGWGGTAIALFAGTLLLAAIARFIQRLFHWFLRFSRPTRVAIGVLGGAAALFVCGIRFVVWTQSARNEGPNLLMISVDGLRRETLEKMETSGPIARWVRRARVVGRAVPPSTDFMPTIVTALSGRSPLTHGIRHDFPAAQDMAADPDSLPTLLRRNGWTTTIVSDGPESVWERLGKEFDVAHVSSSALRDRLFRRQGERSPHLLPYLSGRVGRAIPLLRGSPFLSDPALLAREAGNALGKFRGTSKFFLWVHFSAPGPLSVVASPPSPERMSLFRRPGDGRSERGLTETEWASVRGLYDQNAAALQGALNVLFETLADRGWEENTAVILWSPRATLLSSKEESDALSLKGPAFFELPFLAVPPGTRAGGRRYLGLGRTVDVAPTAARLLGMSGPLGWEGLSLIDGLPEGEAGIISFESSTPFLETDRPFRTPPMIRLLVEDRDFPGHLRLDAAWEDSALIFRDRALHLGDERLVYRPGINGVSFEYYKLSEDPEAQKNLANARQGKARVKELREIFYRSLSREAGWRPQNDFWIPEAFLREEATDDKRGGTF